MKDITNMKSGYLTAMRYLARGVWECECDCGNICYATTYEITTEAKKSCGCLTSEYFKRAKGQSKTRLYKIWWSIISRCNNPKHNMYRAYGAKGIGVCEEWMRGFETFKIWSLENGYTENSSCRRINTSMNFSPDNCRWVVNNIQESKKKFESPLYRKWTALRRNGFEICNEWKGNFDAFKVWAYENGYNDEDNQWLKRIDKSAGYYPDNCVFLKIKPIESFSPLYSKWITMRALCNCKRGELHRLYTARGIKVCDEWVDDFKAFETWSFENGYTNGSRLRRISGRGNFSPDNCKWI